MTGTAEGMVRNLASLLQVHGHVPNGARSYYLNRSQPPLLSAMVKLLRRASSDPNLLLDIYPVSSTYGSCVVAPHPPGPCPLSYVWWQSIVLIEAPLGTHYDDADSGREGKY